MSNAVVAHVAVEARQQETQTDHLRESFATGPVQRCLPAVVRRGDGRARELRQHLRVPQVPLDHGADERGAAVDVSACGAHVDGAPERAELRLQREPVDKTAEEAQPFGGVVEREVHRRRVRSLG